MILSYLNCRKRTIECSVCDRLPVPWYVNRSWSDRRMVTGSSRPADLVPRTVPIPGGRFRMGSATGRSDEQPVHVVEVGPFRVGRTPLTNLEYARFLARGRVPEPSWWTDAGYWALDQPVVGVTWFDAMSYAGWLSEVAG